jgi:phospholipase C
VKNLLAVSSILGCLGCSGGANVGPRSSLDSDAAAAARAACTFTAGTLPGLSLADKIPLGTEIPIDTVVIIMMENRSFDHLLGNIQAMQPDADVAPPGVFNLDTDGTQVPRFHLTEFCFDDPDHGWTDTHNEWDGGKMDGFVTVNNLNDGAPADGKRAMGYYTEQDLPFMYSLASTFSLADRSFSSLLGPTFPNRSYLEAATSYGETGGTLFTDARLNLIELLETGNVTWHDYYTNLPTLGIFLDSFTKHLDNASMVSDFMTDAQMGNLSQVNFVDPDLAQRDEGLKNDFHPPGDVQLGDEFVSQVVNALIASPQWPRMAVFITFDEHGGAYDHVPPPPACPPDALTPNDLGPNDYRANFDRLGIRVPTIVVSPYAKPHYVSHVVYDHTSILRFIESRFILPAMTARDANADPLFDMFDFTKPQMLHPPSLPTVNVDPAQKAACAMKYPMDAN